MPDAAPQTQRILVTGAAGFVGFHLASRLLERGCAVHGVDSLNDYYDVSLKRARLERISAHPAFSFSHVDLSDYAAVAGILAAFKPECVVHFAAQAGVRYSLVNPRAYVASNVDGFVSLLEACRAHPVRHLLYASSSSVYGANTKVPYHEDDPVNAPVSLYAASKRSDELIAQTYAHLFAIPCSGLRFFTVYGPWGRPDMAYYSFTKAILEERTIDIFNHGRMQRDFTYIDDVVIALEKLLELPPQPGQAANPTGAPHIIYNIGNHTPVELETFVATIEAAVGRKAHKRYLPMQPGEVLVTFADVTRLMRATGYSPSTSIADGMARFVAWYRAYHG